MYGGLAIWSAALITQILSMAGIAASTNVMVWTWGVAFGGMILGVAYQVLALIAMNKAYQENQDSAVAQVQTDTATIMDRIESGWLVGASSNAFTGLLLYVNYNNWWAAQEEAMGEKDDMALFSTFSF